MDYQHKNLTHGQWFELNLMQQMSNIGAEIGRAIDWRKKNNSEYSKQAFFRGLELLNLTIDDPKNSGIKLKELEIYTPAKSLKIMQETDKMITSGKINKLEPKDYQFCQAFNKWLENDRRKIY